MFLDYNEHENTKYVNINVHKLFEILKYIWMQQMLYYIIILK